MNLTPPSDPLLADDAPIISLLSLRHGTLVKDMTDDELSAYLARLKALTQQPATLDSALKREAKPKEKKITDRQKKLDLL